jgi:hypothetical protein
MKKLRFDPKEIADLKQELAMTPFEGKRAPRPGGDSMMGTATVYLSRTRENVEYRCIVVNDPEEGWKGMCSCRGWSQLKRTVGETRPCLHIFDRLTRMPEFDLQAMVGVALEKEEVRRHELEQKRIEAQAKLAQYEKDHTPVAAQVPAILPDVVEEDVADAITVWSSRAPLLSVCPASLVSDGSLSIREYSSPAPLGSTVHKAAELIITGQLDAPPDLTQILEDAGVTEPTLVKDYWSLSWAAVREWQGKEGSGIEPLKAYFPSVYLEQKMQHRMNLVNPHTGQPQLVVLTAKPDFYGPSHEQGHWIVGDWKTNRKEDEPFYAEQLKMEAAVILAQDKSIHRVTTIIVWLRHGTRDIRTYSRDEIRAWLQELAKRRLFWDGKTYVSGEHCMYCQRAYGCEGRKQQFRANVNLLSAVDVDLLLYDDEGKLLHPDLLLDRLETCKTFRKIDKAYTNALKGLLTEGGSRPLLEREGYALGIKEGRGSLSIDTVAAWPLIMTVLTSEQVTKAITIKLSELETAVKEARKTCPACLGIGYSDEAGLTKCAECDGLGKVEVYPQGTKGQVWKDLLDKLETSGAAKRGAPRREIAVLRMGEQDAIEAESEEGAES